MEQVRVEVVVYAPTAFYHCQHCELTWREAGLGEHIHRDQAASSLPPDLSERYHEVADFAHSLLTKHGNRVRLRVIDAASIEGFVRSLRHRLRRYPAVIVKGRALGDDLDAAKRLIEEELSRPSQTVRSPRQGGPR